MQRTALCDRLGIDLSIIEAPMVQAATAQLAAGSNAGGLGSLASVPQVVDAVPHIPVVASGEIVERIAAEATAALGRAGTR